MIGYIKLYRQLFENPDYFYERFSRMQAWIDLLLLANYEDGYIFIRGIRVEVKRGQVAKSLDSLAERWRWSKHTVQRYLKELETALQIALQKQNAITLITIVNYEKYQGVDDGFEGQTALQIAPQTALQTKEKSSPNTPTKESNKEEKEDKETNNELLVKKERPPVSKPIEERKQWLIDRMKEADNGLPKLMLNEFYLYWTETTSRGKEKMRFELEKTWVTSRRLARWYNNNSDKKWKS